MLKYFHYGDFSIGSSKDVVLIPYQNALRDPNWPP